MSSSPPADQEARTQRHLACLDTLIAQGMDLATRLHEQSTTPSDLCSALAAPGVAIPVITEETVILFTQISRAVRRTILLSRKLAEPLAPAKSNPANDKRIIREDEHTINDEAGPDGAETLGAERHERVETGDLAEDIGHRPVHEIIAELARNLGIAENWNATHLYQVSLSATLPRLTRLGMRAGWPAARAKRDSDTKGRDQRALVLERPTPQNLQARAAQPNSPAEPTANKPRRATPRTDPRDDPEVGITVLNGYGKPELRPPKR